MKVAVLSGKGGTGKTFVSVNLACTAGQAAYADFDVEEPNGYLFLKPEIVHRFPVSVPIPEVIPNKCTGCRVCVDFCAYNALALVGNRLLVFQEMCHSCGGCVRFCPAGALVEKRRTVGEVTTGVSGRVRFFSGFLNTGEVSGVQVIKGLLEKLPENGTVIMDCPPGSACSVMECVRAADFCILVTEPTLFGVQNLSMVYELVKLFKKPCCVVINKDVSGQNPAEQFCREQNVPIGARIPFDESVGRLNSDGLIIVRENDTYRELFEKLLVTTGAEAVQ